MDGAALDAFFTFLPEDSDVVTDGRDAPVRDTTPLPPIDEKWQDDDAIDKLPDTFPGLVSPVDHGAPTRLGKDGRVNLVPHDLKRRHPHGDAPTGVVGSITDRDRTLGHRIPFFPGKERIAPATVGEQVGMPRWAKVAMLGAAAITAIGAFVTRGGNHETEPVAAPPPAVASPSPGYMPPTEPGTPVDMGSAVTPEAPPEVAQPEAATPPVVSEAASTVEPGEGLFQTYKELGIPKSEWDGLSQRVGPQLNKLGAVYADPTFAGGYGFMRPGQLPPAVISIIQEAAGLNPIDDHQKDDVVEGS